MAPPSNSVVEVAKDESPVDAGEKTPLLVSSGAGQSYGNGEVINGNGNHTMSNGSGEDGGEEIVHYCQAAGGNSLAPQPNLWKSLRGAFDANSHGVANVRAVEGCCASGSCTANTGPTFTPGKGKLKMPPCCEEGFCKASTTSSCCATGTCTGAGATPAMTYKHLIVDTADEKKTVRSTITCSGICCSAEVPLVNEVIDELDGISKSMINVPLKQVVIDHDPSVISAKDIEDALNQEHFGAVVKRDGGAGLEGAIGRSHYHVKKICCAAEIPIINGVLEPINGVSNVAFNITAKMVYVDHDTNTVSAQALCDALNDATFGATLKKDAGKASKGGTASFVRSTLKIETDTSDVEMVEEALKTFKSSELESFVVDGKGKAITLSHNPLVLPLESVVSHLKKEAGFVTSISFNGEDDIVWDFPSYEDVTSNQEVDSGDEDKLPKPTVILSGIFWILSMFSNIGGYFEYLKYLGLLAFAFGIPNIAVKAFSTMRRFMFDSNCLMLFAAVGALGFQEYDEAAAVTFLFSLSDWLEGLATTRGRNALSAIVSLRPEFAWIVHPKTKEQQMIPASYVPVGAIVAVKTGDKIPCDGVVVEGQSAVDESSLTGESRPVKKQPKSLVSGGTVNCGQNHLMIQTTSTAENSAISRLVTLVEEAQANRSETEKLVDEFAKVYTPIVVLAALCMCTIPWSISVESGRTWTYNGLVLIVVACPCALIISTPVTYVAALAATAQRGVLVKGGAHLEALGLVKTICFDKTGTLTQGSYALISITPIGDKYTREQMLEFMVLMEERANHPLALAIVDGARLEGVTSANSKKKVDEHKFMAGEGLVGRIDGMQVYVGNTRLFERLGMMESLSEEMENMVYNWEAMAMTVGFMSIEGAGIVCAYCVADAVRNESMEVIDALEKMKIDLYMLTGDNRDAARAIGQMVGMNPESINSELLPEEKLQFITKMKGAQDTGRSVLTNPMGKRDLVCHVGDGVNDAPALAAADVGVAMGVGAALAMETADVTLLDSNLRKLLYSIDMGRRVLWTIKENVAFSLIVKIIVLGFTIVGDVSLWVAIMTDVGAMLCVTLNGMRLLPSRKIDAEQMGDVGNSSYRSQVGV
ncbi:Putative inactive cadmium/zinc-transporting ATPase HMA3 [Seminavis robusta]|uniref:Inactive cadmium/zinc-transporting ATPase HMA3 n=1 Tax=Seminavis robusta TaxID=568900 RepID=A0A9N8H8E7_9STRA|nr:Putative inactive cadmium/zinc-transporting ATPase HMA3 [Seminavis robusta]|eukprot:Sro215_g088970.1 Putative inactive cadmium/zinc-transporting ATPase HMA3 (1101) ;mRNA; f:27791-31545